MIRHLLALFAIALALAGCTNSSTAPQTRFALLDGSSKTTTDLQGKVALINFWATSCTTCVAEMAAGCGPRPRCFARAAAVV